MKDFGYELNADSRVVACYTDASKGIPTDINPPFTFDSAFDYRFDFETNTWVSTVVNYQYIIIPTDLIPLLVDSVGLVEEVLTGNEFTVYLSNIGLIQRDGTKKNVKTLPISFTPCTILDWEEGDETQLQAIINQFNALYNPPSKIDFPCKFDSLQDFETFKQNYSYI